MALNMRDRYWHFRQRRSDSLRRPKAIDQTSPCTNIYGQKAQRTNGCVQILWAGNAVLGHVLRYTGTNNHRDPLLTRMGGTVPTATVNGDLLEDINKEGAVKRCRGSGSSRPTAG